MATARPKVVDHNVMTGEIVERAMTDEELAQYKAEQLAQAELEKRQNVLAAARGVLLERLGITEDEARLLLS